MGVRNRVGIGLSCLPARLQRLAGRCDTFVLTLFLTPIDCSKIPVHCNENPIYIFPGSIHIFSCSRIDRSNVGISLQDTWMWKLRLKPHISLSGNICFEFSVLCLCSARTGLPKSLKVDGIEEKHSTLSEVFLSQFRGGWFLQRQSHWYYPIPSTPWPLSTLISCYTNTAILLILWTFLDESPSN